ncbi:hypothetical protein [Streptomyces griseorubiginosus]|uniref:hypothetical protein n=1 Tax=Streptomyces griseorubiginosus TaxID=67304 RepID=UPI0036492EF6
MPTISETASAMCWPSMMGGTGYSPHPMRRCELAGVRSDGPEIAPNNIVGTRLKPKRLAERGIPVEIEEGLFTRPRP